MPVVQAAGGKARGAIARIVFLRTLFNKMEAGKITDAIKARYGPCVAEIPRTSEHYALCMERFPYHVMYFLYEREKLVCWYAMAEDLQSCGDESREKQDWKEQEKLQLVRQYSMKSTRQIIPRILEYVDDALKNMELRQFVDDRGFYRRVKTFAEAKMEAKIYPKPKRPPPTIPPPLCRRHNDVHWESEKKRRNKEGWPEKKEEKKKTKPKKKKKTKTYEELEDEFFGIDFGDKAEDEFFGIDFGD